MNINKLFRNIWSIQTERYYYPGKIFVLVFLILIQTRVYSQSKPGMWGPQDTLDLIMERIFPHLTPLTTSDGVVYYDYRFAEIVNKKCSTVQLKKWGIHLNTPKLYYVNERIW